MTAALAATLAAAIAIGLLLGLLGGGGSILTVPVLVYLAGIEPKAAIAMSLFIVGATSLIAMGSHAHAGRVQWRTGVIFGSAGMAGAYAGGRIAEYLPGALLLTGFALMMVLTAVAMIRRCKKCESETAPRRRPVLKILAEGATVGLFTGLVGAGGGFLVVPALVILGGLSMQAAVGTSLLVIVAKSFAGLAGYLHSTTIDWPLTLSMTALAIVGSLIGGTLVGRMDPAALRRAFGWFVAVMGVALLAGQLASA
ncbi:sulfite exporter TauE/SafE family protein [Glycomyces sp. L485]|uniref:sulfite exporter TauE/SafE family protein n=1 Tax=Glycomyces sp. L485 TaxID=2909235 RepID=UPI001F4B3963|nr:sulfite exporter TauE/SafE family protein [Glycomyces sp. L485]